MDQTTRPTPVVQHIGTARELGLDVAGFLMMSHLNEPQDRPVRVDPETFH